MITLRELSLGLCPGKMVDDQVCLKSYVLSLYNTYIVQSVRTSTPHSRLALVVPASQQHK